MFTIRFLPKGFHGFIVFLTESSCDVIEQQEVTSSFVYQKERFLQFRFCEESGCC